MEKMYGSCKTPDCPAVCAWPFPSWSHKPRWARRSFPFRFLATLRLQLLSKAQWADSARLLYHFPYFPRSLQKPWNLLTLCFSVAWVLVWQGLACFSWSNPGWCVVRRIRAHTHTAQDTPPLPPTHTRSVQFQMLKIRNPAHQAPHILL